MLEGADNTIRDHCDNQEGHGGGSSHLCPLPFTGREGAGAQKQPCLCCQPFWPCSAPCTPTRHCPPFSGQMVLEHARLLLLEQGLHLHWGLY